MIEYESGNIVQKPGLFYWIKFGDARRRFLGYCIAPYYYMIPEFKYPIMLDEKDFIACVNDYEKEKDLE